VRGRSFCAGGAEPDDVGAVENEDECDAGVAPELAGGRCGVWAGDGWEDWGKGRRSLLEGVPYILLDPFAALRDMVAGDEAHSERPPDDV